MDKVYKFPDRRTIAEEAVTWLVKLDSDDPPTQKELEAFREWLNRSPVHREEVNSLNAFWGNNILTELMVPLGKHKVSPEPANAITRSAPWRPRSLLATAALLLMGVAITFTFWLLQNPPEATNGLYVTAVGQQKTLTLRDGSVVELNTNSQIKVDYNDRYRNIQLLQGEVYFKVAKAPDHPFRVYAGGGRVQAVGTAFTVYLKNKDVNVIVNEGRVALATLQTRVPETAGTTSQTGNAKADKNSPPANRAQSPDMDPYVKSLSKNLGILNAGQSITINVSDGSQVAEDDTLDAENISAEELARRQAWRDGLLIFTGEPLQQVVNEIGRYTTMTIELADPELGKIQIGGRFKVGDMEAMFAALETNFNLEVTKLNYDRVLLSASD